MNKLPFATQGCTTAETRHVALVSDVIPAVSCGLHSYVLALCAFCNSKAGGVSSRSMHAPVSQVVRHTTVYMPHNSRRPMTVIHMARAGIQCLYGAGMFNTEENLNGYRSVHRYEKSKPLLCMQPDWLGIQWHGYCIILRIVARFLWPGWSVSAKCYHFNKRR